MQHIPLDHPALKHIEWNSLVDHILYDSLYLSFPDCGACDDFELMELIKTHKVFDAFKDFKYNEGYETISKHINPNGHEDCKYRQTLWLNEKECLSLFSIDNEFHFTYGNEDTFIHVIITENAIIVYVPEGSIDLEGPTHHPRFINKRHHNIGLMDLKNRLQEIVIDAINRTSLEDSD